MTASELRLGNLVQYGGCTAKVCQIEKAFFYCETDGNDFFTRDGESGAKPITLTEELLLKFGFEKQSKRFYTLNNWVVEYREGTKLFNFVADESIDIIVKYAHQLQNLCFALTGEELTFKSE